jgi:hypothetical protein
MGQLMDTCKYRRECKKCRLIDIETDDLFDDTPLPYIGSIKERRMWNEHVMNNIMNSKRYIYALYKKENQLRANNIYHK